MADIEQVVVERPCCECPTTCWGGLPALMVGWVLLATLWVGAVIEDMCTPSAMLVVPLWAVTCVAFWRWRKTDTCQMSRGWDIVLAGVLVIILSAVTSLAAC